MNRTFTSCREAAHSARDMQLRTHRSAPEQTIEPPPADPLQRPEIPAALRQPAISAREWRCLERFQRAVDDVQREECVRCNEKWFNMVLLEGACSRCRLIDNRRDGIHLFTAENYADVGLVPAYLPKLTQVEEQLIARVHVHIQVWQFKGQQYK